MTTSSTDRPEHSSATREKLAAIFRAVFEVADHTDVSRYRQGEQAGWDSLAHALLMAAVESEFAIEIDAGDSLDLTSFEALERYLTSRGV